MNCEEFKKILEEKSGDFSSDSEKKAWESHHGTCESCRREFQEFEALEGMIRSLPPQEVPDDLFWERQTKAILRHVGSSPRRPSSFWAAFLEPRPLLAAAAVVFLMVFSLWFLRQQNSLPEKAPRFAEQQVGEDDFSEDLSASEDPIDELNAEQTDSYYAVLAQKYLPASDEWEDDSDPVTDLSPEELDRVLNHFEKANSRR